MGSIPTPGTTYMKITQETNYVVEYKKQVFFRSAWGQWSSQKTALIMPGPLLSELETKFQKQLKKDYCEDKYA